MSSMPGLIKSCIFGTLERLFFLEELEVFKLECKATLNVDEKLRVDPTDETTSLPSSAKQMPFDNLPTYYPTRNI